MAKTNGWREYKKLLLEAHQENKLHLRKIDESIMELKIEVAKLKTKEKVVSTVFGTLGGGIVAGIIATIQFIF